MAATLGVATAAVFGAVEVSSLRNTTHSARESEPCGRADRLC